MVDDTKEQGGEVDTQEETTNPKGPVELAFASDQDEQEAQDILWAREQWDDD